MSRKSRYLESGWTADTPRGRLNCRYPARHGLVTVITIAEGDPPLRFRYEPESGELSAFRSAYSGHAQNLKHQKEIRRLPHISRRLLSSPTKWPGGARLTKGSGSGQGRRRTPKSSRRVKPPDIYLRTRALSVRSQLRLSKMHATALKFGPVADQMRGGVWRCNSGYRGGRDTVLGGMDSRVNEKGGYASTSA